MMWSTRQVLIFIAVMALVQCASVVVIVWDFNDKYYVREKKVMMRLYRLQSEASRRGYGEMIETWSCGKFTESTFKWKDEEEFK